MENVKKCLLCGAEEHSLFDKRELHGYEITNRLCNHCGYVFLSPRMMEKELDEFYKSKYRTLYQGQEAPNEGDLLTQQKRADHLLALAKENKLKIVRHLDIGSSAGILLKTFEKGYSCEPVGIEPGDGYRKYAEEQNLKIYRSLDELKEKKEKGFDLISMSHVLEHIPNPINFLSDLKSLLSETGVIMVEVPNLYGHTSFEISHLSSFSKHTLNEVFTQSGYQTIQIKVHGKPRSEILPLYLTLLAKPHKEKQKPGVSPEGLVALKRNIGMLNQRIMGRLFPTKAWLPKN